MDNMDKMVKMVKMDKNKRLYGLEFDEIKLDNIEVMEEAIQPGGLVCGMGCVAGGLWCGWGGCL